jgi:hypothetical protein
VWSAHIENWQRWQQQQPGEALQNANGIQCGACGEGVDEEVKDEWRRGEARAGVSGEVLPMASEMAAGCNRTNRVAESGRQLQPSKRRRREAPNVPNVSANSTGRGGHVGKQDGLPPSEPYKPVLPLVDHSLWIKVRRLSPFACKVIHAVFEQVLSLLVWDLSNASEAQTAFVNV